MRLTCRDSDIGVKISHPNRALEIFMPMMLPDRETLVAMFLDDSQKVITAVVVNVGTATQVDCNPYEIILTCRVLGAKSFLIAHNHPNGNPRPSDPDVATTRLIDGMANRAGIKFIDHLVITTDRERWRSVFDYMEKGF